MQTEPPSLLSLDTATARFIAAGEFGQAMEALCKSLSIEPLNPQRNFLLASLLHKFGSSEKALHFASIAVLAPSVPSSHFELLVELYEALDLPLAAASIKGLHNTIPNHEKLASDGSSHPASTNLTGSWLECAQYLSIGSGTHLTQQSTCEVRFRPHHPSLCVEIGRSSVIACAISILRKGASVRIGDRSCVRAQILIAAERIEIGNDVMIDPGVTFMDNDSHSLIWEERKNDVVQCGRDWIDHPSDFIRNKDWSNVRTGRIVVEDKVWIGFNSTVLKGVTIGEGAVVFPGSVVTRSIAPWTVVAGNPAIEIDMPRDKLA